MDSSFSKMGIRLRYIAAIAATVAFSIVVLALASIINYIINVYFPQYSAYVPDIITAANTLILIIGTYVVYRIIGSIITAHGARKNDLSTADIQKLILRVLFWFAVVFILLAESGISISDALAGGAVGGIVIGLAVQTVASSIISGILLSSSRTLAPGDIIVMRSGSWGSTDIAGKVTKVNLLYSDIVTPNGNIMKLPNTMLMSNTIFTHAKIGSGIKYPFQVTINSDVPYSEVIKKVTSRIDSEFRKFGLQPPDIYFTGKSGSTNVFTVIINFSTFTDFNKIVDSVNREFDGAYWSAKEAPAKKG